METDTDLVPLPSLKNEIKHYLYTRTQVIFQPTCLDKFDKTQSTIHICTHNLSVSSLACVSVCMGGGGGGDRILKYFDQLLLSFSFLHFPRKWMDQILIALIKIQIFCTCATSIFQ